MLQVVFTTILIVSVAAVHAAEPVVVTAPAEPPSIETWTLEEVWRLEGDDPEAPLLGVPRGAVVYPDGDLLLLDHQLAHLLVFSPAGEHVATLSRQGEGPGELQLPSGIFMFSDGALGVLQSYPPKIEKLARDGTPLATIRRAESGGGLWWMAREAGGVVVVSGDVRDFSNPGSGEQETRHFVSRISEEGETLHTYLQKITTIDWSHLRHDEAMSHFPARSWALCHDGTLVRAVDRDAYRIEFLTPEGEIFRVVERPFEPYLRTEQDLEILAANMTFTVGGEAVEAETNFLPTAITIRGIDVHDDGTLWITSCYGSRDLPEGVSRRYDVFEADGTFRSEVRIAYRFDDGRDALIATNDGGFLHLRNIASASEAMYKGTHAGQEDESEEVDDEEVVLEVIRLRRAN